MIKMATVNEARACHTKQLARAFAQTVLAADLTMNDEPEDLMVLPPFDDRHRGQDYFAQGVPAAHADAHGYTEQRRRRFSESACRETPAFLPLHWSLGNSGTVSGATGSASPRIITLICWRKSANWHRSNGYWR